MASINVCEVIDFIQDQFLGMEGLQLLPCCICYTENTHKKVEHFGHETWNPSSKAFGSNSENHIAPEPSSLTVLAQTSAFPPLMSAEDKCLEKWDPCCLTSQFLPPHESHTDAWGRAGALRHWPWSPVLSHFLNQRGHGSEQNMVPNCLSTCFQWK